MKIFIHTNNDLKYSLIDIKPNQKVGFLIKKITPKLASNKDFKEDVEVYLKNQDEDLNKDKSLVDAGLEEGAHVFIGRCSKVNVVVNYAGKVCDLIVPSSTNIRKLRRKVLKYFGISPDDGVDLLLMMNGIYLDDKNLIGSTVKYPNCDVSLILASKQDIQGSPSEEILEEHIVSSEYLAGELENSWGYVNNVKGPNWPFFYFWVKAKNSAKYYFKFDFTGYNESAPTAVLWDIEKSLPLEQNQWPNWNKRCLQIFRKWGKECLYIPCDRMAFHGHSDWTQKHPNLIWKSAEDTVVKYLTELHQTLNH